MVILAGFGIFLRFVHLRRASRIQSLLIFSGAAEWVEQNTPPGIRVFQTDWFDSPRMFFYNTPYAYLVGLAPTYMQQYNPDLYVRWVEVPECKVGDPAGISPDRLTAQCVVSDLNHRNFLDVAENDPKLVEFYRDIQGRFMKLCLMANNSTP